MLIINNLNVFIEFFSLTDLFKIRNVGTADI